MINLKKFAAEFVGTFLLVFLGTGAIVVNDAISGNLTVVGVSLAFGLAVGLSVYLFSSISGAHINPAVTLGFWLEGRLNRFLVFMYLGAQFTGALLASGILRLAVPSHPTLGATIPAINLAGALFLEAFLTFNLMMVILIFGGKKISSAFAIGGTVAISSLFAGPFTGASMNPARSLGPAFFSGNFDTLWIYLLGPVLGGIFAVFAWYFIKPKFSGWQNQER